jgi:protein TonB
MALDVEIYGYRQSLAPSFGVSAALHAGLVLFLFLVPTLLRGPLESWGSRGSGASAGEAMNARLVSGIPLPPNPRAKPKNVLATENKGLSRSVPAPKVKPREDPEAIALAEKQAKLRKALEKIKKQKELATAAPPKQAVPPPPVATPSPSTLPPPKPAPEDNTVPYGEGGPAAGPYTTVTAGTGAGGLKFGEGGTGNFGSRFGWYADVVARKVHEAWQSEVNPNVISAKRVYILFDISRKGAPSKVRIEQSSGVPSLDQSAVRAIRRIDTFGPLPAAYKGSSISVEFWFDYQR